MLPNGAGFHPGLILDDPPPPGDVPTSLVFGDGPDFGLPFGAEPAAGGGTLLDVVPVAIGSGQAEGYIEAEG